MILSALLTSVGINLGLCFLFFTLYSILRKQSSYVKVYAPRLVAERKLKLTTDFNLESLLPSVGWVRRAWNLSEDDLLENSGLDGVVFMRIFRFSLRVLAIATGVGVFILLPVNFMGNQLDIDFSDIQNKSLDSFSISNVNNGSKRLWIHFCAAYAFTGAVCYYLYGEYQYMSSRRLRFFYASQPVPHHFTLLVSCIPTKAEKSLNETVEHFFREYHPTTYLSHAIVRRTSKHKEIPAAFVNFKSRYGAAVALHIQQGINPTEWVTEQAPEPDDVYWPFFSSSYVKRWIYKVVVLVVTVVVTILFLLPVVLVQGLTQLEKLESYFPFLKSILTITFVGEIITGYLPSLILQSFLYLVPPFMKMLSSFQGYISTSEIEKSACYKMLWFTIWNIFFATVLSGTALNRFDFLLEPKTIPMVLAQSVPGQASFFISYVVTSGWTSLSSELFQLVSLVCSSVKSMFGREENDDYVVPSIPFESEIPRILFFGLLGIIYFFLAPLILPFLLVYFGMGYLIFQNQLLSVYAPKYDTAGKYWPIVHTSTIISLVIMHVIAIGIFALKDLRLASTLTVPLPVLTLLFHKYCHDQFKPIFIAYSAECLINKDKEEQEDPRMPDFWEKMVDAYQHPGEKLHPNSTDSDRQSSPLLHSSNI